MTDDELYTQQRKIKEGGGARPGRSPAYSRGSGSMVDDRFEGSQSGQGARTVYD
jgi:hypothetical protein